MGNIIIRKVHYEGEYYEYISPELYPGINVIEGVNGSGKTTFMNLIYFGLGGNVKEFNDKNVGTHKEIKEDKNNYVELLTQINGRNYRIKRLFNSNDIFVLDPDDNLTVFPVYRTSDSGDIFSDWMLHTLGIAIVEIYQGINNWKINFKDLFRVIYHDQNPDPSKVYRQPDVDNFFSDSEYIRKVIFELMLGNSYSEYYTKLAEFRKVDREKNIAKLTLDQFIAATQDLIHEESLNMVFLKNKSKELSERLKELYKIRENLKSRRDNSTVDTRLDLLKKELLHNEIQISDLNLDKNEILSERVKLLQLKEDTILEVTQIKKIIFSHENLSLFSPDTCPYCLKKIHRKKGHCVCGEVVEESDFERFFYNTEEYLEILKTKQKSVDTVNLAIQSCDLELENIEKKITVLVDNNDRLQKTIKESVMSIDFKIDIHSLDSMNDEIISVRERLLNLSKQIEIESKKDKLQVNYDEKVSMYGDLKTEVKKLEGESIADMRVKLKAFNSKFNEIMRNSLKDCRSARISLENYFPIINNGEYREASASVIVRLMYYFTMLYMSLEYDDVKFPRFLLVDNPQTSGIDMNNLTRAFDQIWKVIPKGKENDYQVILATGPETYPKSFKSHVFTNLEVGELLLKQK